MKITDLSFSYDEKREIFSSATIEFRRPVELIMGPSGCGKTTLLKLISGVIPIEGIDRDLPRGRKLLIIQEDALIPWLSGWDNILAFVSALEVTRASVENHEGYSTIEAFLDMKAWQMSYGQRRSIELIRAFLYRPAILCLDEPFNYVDPDRRYLLSKLILRSGIEQIIISTHEPEDFVGKIEDALVFDGRFPVRKLDRRRIGA